MKQKAIALLIAASLFAGSFPPPVLAVDKPMHAAVEQLDLDGDLVLFLNTSTIEEKVLAYIDTISGIMQRSMSRATPEEILAVNEGIEMVKAAIEWSGLLSLEAYAMSTAPADNELSRVVSICRHAEADSDRALWRLIASEPRELKGIHYAPSNAVYTANSTTSLNEAWKIANEAVAEFGGPEGVMAFNQQMMMAQMIIGTNINVITESIEEDLLVSIQLSEEKQIEIPQATGRILSFPEPSLLIGFGAKNHLLGNILLQKLQLAGMTAVQSTYNGYELHTVTFPGPSPVPLSPTLVMTDDYLLIGSTSNVVQNALDARADKTGLTSTELYTQLLGNAPEKVSAIEFLSPRFMETYLAIFTSTMGEDPDTAPMVEIMTETWSKMFVGGYALKTPNGLYSESFVNYGGAKPAELVAAMYIGVLAAVAIPAMTGNMDRAMTTEAQAGCATISTSLRLHLAEHGTIVGVTDPFSLEALTPGDLNGTYFKDSSYSVSVVSDDNYTITAKGVGKAADIVVIMNVENGEVSWVTP